MILLLGMLLIGVFLLTAGAELFVRGSSLLALRLGVSPLIIGLTVVAFGTSAPELFVSVKSALTGSPGIAVGNVIGSNIANIALILGACALITPLVVQRQLVKYDTPFMIFITIVCFILLLNRNISRIDAAVLLLLFIVYLSLTIRISLKESVAESNGVDGSGKTTNMILILVFIVAGLGLLLYGANVLVTAGVKLARHLGISETIIGISIIAVGTSLPELAASLMASFKKESDIAIGNIVGSNVFNIGLVLGTAGVICPISVPTINIIDISTMLLLSVLLLPFLKSGFKLNRIEGLFLLVCYAGYMTILWW